MLGPSLQGGLTRRLYQPSNPAGIVWAIIFLVLFVIVNQVMQAVFGFLALDYVVGGERSDPRAVIAAFLVGLLPASLVTAAVVWGALYFRGGRPAAVLSLRAPQLGLLGWVVVIFAFLAIMYALIMVIVALLGIDLSQYTPGPHGESPETGSAGLVKEAMFAIANDPKLFWLVLPSVAIGAPLAEEFVFRGQIFAALAQSRIGFIGASLITSLLWSLMHITEPWLSIGLIFAMGLVFSWMLYRFGSLWLTMACHTVWNTIYSLVIFGTIQT